MHSPPCPPAYRCLRKSPRFIRSGLNVDHPPGCVSRIAAFLPTLKSCRIRCSAVILTSRAKDKSREPVRVIAGIAMRLKCPVVATEAAWVTGYAGCSDTGHILHAARVSLPAIPPRMPQLPEAIKNFNFFVCIAEACCYIIGRASSVPNHFGLFGAMRSGMKNVLVRSNLEAW